MSEPARQLRLGGNPGLPRKRPYRETPEMVAMAVRVIHAIGVRCADDDPDTVVLLRELEQALEQAWSTAIAGMRAAGHSDRVIARELGVTRQAVEKRWPRSRRRPGSSS